MIIFLFELFYAELIVFSLLYFAFACTQAINSLVEVFCPSKKSSPYGYSFWMLSAVIMFFYNFALPFKLYTVSVQIGESFSLHQQTPFLILILLVSLIYHSFSILLRSKLDSKEVQTVTK